MTATEIAFLAIGLILGIAAGAALIATLRSRTPSTREVRITMAPDAVPRRRAATLANDAFTDSPVAIDPARFGPADRSAFAGASSANGTPVRTRVLDPRPGTVLEPAFRLVDPATNGNGAGPAAPNRLVVAQAMPISTGIDPMLTALRASAAASAEAALRPSRASDDDDGDRELVAAAAVPIAVAMAGRSPIDPGGDDEPDAHVASAPRTGTTSRSRRGAAGAAAAATAALPSAPDRSVPTSTDGSPGGPCGDARRLADERCELATRARGQATEAEEAHRAAQRAYDDHEIALVKATSDADPRAIRAAKDQAQARFRAARSVARSQQDTETAARDWLHEINRINGISAEASGELQRLRDGAPGLAVRLERSGLEADGARVAAEAAEAACVAARQALADCEERFAATSPRPTAIEPDGHGADPFPAGSDSLADALRAGASPRIVRLLRGDRGAMQDAVAALGGDDPTERRRWQVALSDLIDAIVADAIASSALEYPTDHSFWGPFDRSQSRDMTAALASLGYRFDGLGGWVDDRYPSQRDLSLAMGYAGLDPMRVRQWPSETETAELFRDVQVAAAEHLASAAGDMSLGSLVAMLGRRADGLTEIWNAWGRVRPVLLDES
ncbi:MAG: hypothetical protein ACJ77D_03600 [Chloroflexota bacterium]